MPDFLIKLLNMSIAASWLILVVMILRLSIRKIPKWVFLAFWCIVAIKLICPFSIESVLSLIPSEETIVVNPYTSRPVIQSGFQAVDAHANNYIASNVYMGVTVPTDYLHTQLSTITVVWLIGVGGVLVYTAVQYLRLRRKTREATLLYENIFFVDDLKMPFVFGIIRPRIYIPYSLEGKDLSYVIAHEQAHIDRRDHLWKPLAFIIVALHWFNPLGWIAYSLFCKDLELACDETVIRTLNISQRADYSQALLNCSSNTTKALYPLTFAEIGVKTRIKAIINYTRTSKIMYAFSMLMVLLVSLCFITSPVQALKGGALIQATGVNGQVGYIYEADLRGNEHEDAYGLLSALKRMKEESAETGVSGEYLSYIPLYAEDGKTVIGKYGVGYIGGDYNFDYSIEPGLFKSEHNIMAYHDGNGQLQLVEMDLSKIEPYFVNQTLEYYAYMNIHTADKELIPVILEARNRVVHDKSWVADCTDGWVTDGAGNIIEIVPHFHEVFPEDWEIPWYPPEYNPEGSPYNP